MNKSHVFFAVLILLLVPLEIQAQCPTASGGKKIISVPKNAGDYITAFSDTRIAVVDELSKKFKIYKYNSDKNKWQKEFSNSSVVPRMLNSKADFSEDENVFAVTYTDEITSDEFLDIYEYDTETSAWSLRNTFALSLNSVSHLQLSNDICAVSYSGGGTGSVVVYRKISGTWSLLTTLNGENTGDNFGSALSVYGSDLVIGSPAFDVDPSDNQGKFYVYNCDDMSCSLIDSELGDAAGMNFPVALSLYVDFILAGEQNSNVRMFNYDGMSLTEDFEITSPDTMSGFDGHPNAKNFGEAFFWTNSEDYFLYDYSGVGWQEEVNANTANLALGSDFQIDNGGSGSANDFIYVIENLSSGKVKGVIYQVNLNSAVTEIGRAQVFIDSLDDDILAENYSSALDSVQDVITIFSQDRTLIASQRAQILKLARKMEDQIITYIDSPDPELLVQINSNVTVLSDLLISAEVNNLCDISNAIYDLLYDLTNSQTVDENDIDAIITMAESEDFLLSEKSRNYIITNLNNAKTALIADDEDLARTYLANALNKMQKTR